MEGNKENSSENSTDASIGKAARNYDQVDGSVDYNPFSDSQRPVRGASNPPPVLPAAMDAPPTYSASVGPGLKPTLPGHSDLLKRQEASRDTYLARTPNWPPLPSWCPVQPCLFHDINVEIPQQYQKIVRMGFNLWCIYVLVCFANIIGSLAYFVTGGSAVQFGLSIIQICVLTPCAFVLWYRPLYKAFKNDSSVNFMIYFFVSFVQLIVVAVQVLGLAYNCGWINTLEHFSRNTGAAVVMLLVSIGYTFCGVGMLMLLFRVHRVYRSTGASFAKAQEEFSHGVISNPHVQQAAVNVASTTVRSQFAGSAGPAERY
ncbi:secretory carrier associated membrane protein 2 [Trichuris trichiura]|uniref:Secretory carrier-associated membrane protein n=1 Tax=Trichuris trichiura TaxID=36087 RepID=A0A077Z0G0_TRITR|nr:secretory carrier associated membrane protein 2 [Trichuris trichiura]